MTKFNTFKRIVLPSKKINVFVICILFLGIILGSIFSNIVSLNDRNLIIEKINLFINNINNNSLDRVVVFKNSISINLLYGLLIWILGMTIIGIIFSIFLLFLKSFIVGFSISAFIITYKVKGIVAAFIYLLFGQLLNIGVIIVLTIYSIMFTSKLLTVIFSNNGGNIKRFLKNYLLILVFMIIISFISSLSETFILPAILKLIIRLFI